jgi:hypothetical protein
LREVKRIKIRWNEDKKGLKSKKYYRFRNCGSNALPKQMHNII